MYTNILLPVDGSKHSEKAIEAAISLCKSLNYETKITILHVLPPVNYWGSEMVAANLDIQEIAKQQEERLLQPLRATIEGAGIACNVIHEQGNPADIICSIAESEHIDLIVMGSRGLGTVGEMLLGSVSHKVLQHSICPVLLIK